MENQEIFTGFYKSEIGFIEIKTSHYEIINMDFKDKQPLKTGTTQILEECIKQLDEYFNGNREIFDLNIRIEGTEFQEKVWHELLKIPYGETRSYKDIAEYINLPKAVRAIGNANNKNKISIIIPCHRVIGNNGKLVGYGGGVWRKEWLLDHEQKYI